MPSLQNQKHMAAFKSMLAAALMLSLATLALAKPPYLMVSYGICEDVEGMETISDEGVCQEAGIAIFGDAEKAFRAGQPTGGYRDLNGRPRGCSFAYGDDNISGDMLLFSVAPGDCGTYKLFGCICGSRSAPAATPAPSVEMTPVALGRAGDFVILSKSGITTVPPSVITGDIACSPIAGTAMTGFSFTADASNKFSTSAQLTGQAYAASFAAPTPATLTTAVLDMGIAYTDASQRVTTSPANLNINAGAISGLTFTPGVYKWDSAITFGGDIYIKGNRDSLFIFQTVSNIVAGTAAKVNTPPPRVATGPWA
ncbi:hypothetical protein T484DRAFT_1859048 [Baffinella frigidus]|nr:hypothetical protein T484DRAFT_1859048 [Cryptophyta sp. CCMP2293]